MVEYAEIITLVNLGRAGEARQRFDQKQGKVPEGDYLRMQHWGAELYVCLAEGEHRLDPRAAAPVRHRGAQDHRRGGAARADGVGALEARATPTRRGTCCSEAYDRRQGVRLERALPLLWSWMEAHADEAGVDRSVGGDEPTTEDDPLGGL